LRIIVAGIGIFGVLIGMLGLLAPDRFRNQFKRMTSQTRFLAAIIVRLIVGALFWLAADELRLTAVMRIIAALSIFAAVAILIMGRERLDSLIDWWLSRPDGLLRLSALFAATFGGFLIYVAT
jgi:multisubunit Na+/H+ antiporter MnhG subunit